ncbi:hypothetical protein ZWY2020_008396 [Hordeum vulgare]|nr:hypothetical protein ZWY2020_008396 [Hordeum vulgare]
MGAPKQKWTTEEEAALKVGIGKHGAGKWRTILKDTEFNNILHYRSNVDLKKPRSAPKQESHSTVIATITCDSDDDVVDVKPIIKPIVTFTTGNKPLSRLKTIILEAVKTLNEPIGSYKTVIANYIEPPADFDHVLCAKMNELRSSGKLMKEPTKVEKVDVELARMRNMSSEEAATAPARAVGEEDTIMAEAEAVVREAEAAKADVVASQGFAEAAMLTLKNRSSAKLIIRG